MRLPSQMSARQPASDAVGVRLAALAGPAQAQLNGFNSRVLKTLPLQAEARRWRYKVGWPRAKIEPPPASFVELLVLGKLPRTLSSVRQSVMRSDNMSCAIADNEQWHALVLSTMSQRGACVAELRMVEVALHLLQASRDRTLPVWLCTSGTQPVSCSSMPTHAGLWGLARACRQELTLLPAWCIDMSATSQGMAQVIAHHTLRLPTGRVRALQLGVSVEPEITCNGIAPHVPRLLAPYDAEPTCLAILFEAACQLLHMHTSRATATLDMDALSRGYVKLEELCQTFCRHAALTLPDSKVPVWHHKLVLAWYARQVLRSSDHASESGDLRRAHPKIWAEVQLAERCGPKLADALSGTVAYQELLFPGGSMKAVLPVYEDAVVAAFYNGCVVSAVEMVLSLLPKRDQAVTALEIGAGSGGTASSVLPVIERACKLYIFTDVSEVFLRQARVRFVDYPFLEYKLLNIDVDTRLQGFALHQCDVIIGTNVLHATPFMRNTLHNSKELLRAGGMLIVNDLVATTAFYQHTFGMTDGWWLFAEVQDPERIGQESPLLSWRQWQALLLDNGFHFAHCMQGDTFLRGQAVLVGQTAVALTETKRVVDGAHFFSGGLGGLGLLTARVLIEGGARQVVLSSRSDRVVVGSEREYEWFTKCGVDVRRVRCDVSQEDRVCAVIRDLCIDELRLVGIFHAAHALADATLANQHALNFRTTYGPKVHGAATLHATSCHAPLRFFNVYSSVMGLLGSAGQGPHSAANTWLDSLATWRLQHGVRGQSTNWGVVGEIGYAARHGVDRRADVSGLGVISRAMTIAALSDVLLRACHSFAVLPANWSTLLAGSSEARGLLTPYFHLRGSVQARSSVLRTMASTAADVAVSTVGLDTVLELVQRTAGGFVDADAPLMDAGVDSLGAVELRNQLQSAAGEGTTLPSTVVFDHSTARDLAGLFASTPRTRNPAHLADVIAVLSLDTVLELVQRTAGGFVDADAPLMDAGVDSLGAVELRNQLQSAAGEGTTLPSTVVFDHPTARVLASYFVQEAPPQSASAERAADPSTIVSFVSLATVLPGGSRGVPQAWRVAATGSDAFAPIPALRWDPDSENVRYGAFLCGTELFDNKRFGITTPEVSTMDPQQRLLLEVGYDGLHEAGLMRSGLRESNTAVYVGVMSTEFRDALLFSNAYALTGTGHYIAAGRISYTFGLHGACEAIDVACSSALVACHSARRAVQMQDCQDTLLAGVNMMFVPAVLDSYAAAGIISRLGKSFVFDARADGFTRGESCGAGVLHAAALNTSVLVVGSSVRQDGRSASLTAPNGRAQKVLLHAALADASLTPAQLHLVEAAANGSGLGDSIEAGAIATGLLIPRTSRPDALLIGSVKVGVPIHMHVPRE